MGPDRLRRERGPRVGDLRGLGVHRRGHRAGAHVRVLELSDRSEASGELPASRHRDEGAWQVEAGYSRAARTGRRIAVSGTTCPPGTAADTYAQTREALRRALAAVEELGGGLRDVFRTRLFLVPEADWRDAARAHREALGHVAPANTMLYVAGLIGEGLLVEVEVDAELPER